MAAETLAEFAAASAAELCATLRRFLALQVRGSEQERELAGDAARVPCSAAASRIWMRCRAGLEILRDCDLRSALPEIKQPRW